MSYTEADFLDFRKEIDNIDDQLIDLLDKRIEVVKKVRKFKSANIPKSHSYIKTSREIEMMRDLPMRFSNYPKAAISLIWRIFINSSLRTEHDMNLVLPNRNICNAYWYAREYYSNFTPIDELESEQDVIEETFKRDHSIGVLPFATENCKWWLDKRFQSKDFNVFGILPFIQSINNVENPAYIMFAHIKSENNLEGIKYLYVTTSDIESVDVITEFEGIKLVISKNKLEEGQYINSLGFFFDPVIF